jgi:hypothetical protein
MDFNAKRKMRFGNIAVRHHDAFHRNVHAFLAAGVVDLKYVAS